MGADRKPARPGILVIEDDVVVALMISEFLTAAGYDVLGPFHTDEQGMRVAATAQVHAALVDIRLSREEDSLEIADELNRRDIPFAFLSGAPVSSLLGRYRHALFLAKPFAASEVLELVEALGARSLVRNGL
jgi:DNA-binding response OmpR family regulator